MNDIVVMSSENIYDYIANLVCNIVLIWCTLSVLFQMYKNDSTLVKLYFGKSTFYIAALLQISFDLRLLRKSIFC